MTATFTSRDFNREPGRIKRAATHEHVIITERGQPTIAVLPFADYQRMIGGTGSILDALAMDGVGEIDVDFTMPKSQPRPVSFD